MEGPSRVGTVRAREPSSSQQIFCINPCMRPMERKTMSNWKGKETRGLWCWIWCKCNFNYSKSLPHEGRLRNRGGD